MLAESGSTVNRETAFTLDDEALQIARDPSMKRSQDTCLAGGPLLRHAGTTS